jgi:large subunit ribosomal protein L22
MRLVIDLIRGRGVEEALTSLHFTPKHAARTAEKVLRSAISNLQNKDESGRVDPAELFVKEAFVNGGPVLKRISPAPMGRAYRIRKRSNHITIVVARRERTLTPKAEVRKSAAQETASEKTEPKAAKKSTARPAGKPKAKAAQKS